MALLETKIMQVDNEPSVINDVGEEWGHFGWSVQSVQVTHSQDTKTYTKTLGDMMSGDKTVETTTINYATLTLQRDKQMNNYKEILELEREYIDGLNRLHSIALNKPNTSFNIKMALIMLLVFFPAAIVYTLFKIVMLFMAKKYKDEHAREIAQIRKKCAKLQEEAENLL